MSSSTSSLIGTCALDWNQYFTILIIQTLLLSRLRHLRLVFSDLGFLCSQAQSTRLVNSLPRTETASLLVCVDDHVRLVLVKLVVPLVVAS